MLTPTTPRESKFDHLPVKARLLAKSMAALSEEYWASGWWFDCEYLLWAEMKEEPYINAWNLTLQEKEELAILHELAEGLDLLFGRKKRACIPNN